MRVVLAIHLSSKHILCVFAITTTTTTTTTSKHIVCVFTVRTVDLYVDQTKYQRYACTVRIFEDRWAIQTGRARYDVLSVIN